MKKIFKKIISAIKNFFNRMADQKAERVIDLYSQIFEAKAKGGGKSRSQSIWFKNSH
ncbi:MAG: hypothetical protein WC510_00220 [Candidatus Omnitrophota bacterium]